MGEYVICAEERVEKSNKVINFADQINYLLA